MGPVSGEAPALVLAEHLVMRKLGRRLDGVPEQDPVPGLAGS